jgi:hypothetical protein
MVVVSRSGKVALDPQKSTVCSSVMPFTLDKLAGANARRQLRLSANP